MLLVGRHPDDKSFANPRVRVLTGGEIRLADSDEDRMRVFRFRYQVYVDEMRMPLDAIDSERGIVRDAVDDEARLYFRESSDGQLIATVRQAIGTRDIVDTMEAVFGTRRFRSFCADHELSFSARLAIRRDWRCSTVLRELGELLYRDLISTGVRFDFMVCTPGLLSMYEAIGYQRYKPAVCFSDLGYRIPLVLDVEDYQHLRRIRSPLSRLAITASERSLPLRLRDIVPDAASGTWQVRDERKANAAHLARVFADHSDSPFAQLGERLLWSLLTRFRVLKLAVHEPIIVADTAGDELFLVVRGRADRFVDVGGERHRVESCRDGQCFGIAGFLFGGCRTEQVVIAEDGSELLVIDRAGFDALSLILPQLAAALLPRLQAAQSTATQTINPAHLPEAVRSRTAWEGWRDRPHLEPSTTAP